MASSADADGTNTVGASDFGLQFSTALPAVPGTTLNKIYAQPIVAAGVVIAATEENEVVGLDAVTGNIKWSKVLGPSWPAATVACGDLIPDIGITGTPMKPSDTPPALVWVMRSENPGDANATLYAFDAVPQNGIMHVRYQTNIGPIAKFVQPATDNGRVYVATKSGRVLSFGRPANTPITAPPVDFGYQPVGVKSAPRTLVLTAAVQSARGQVRNPNGLCMDVRGSSPAPGSRVQQAACTQAANQLAAVPGNGSVQLLGQCLDTAGGATAQYTPVVLAPCTGAASEQVVPRDDADAGQCEVRPLP